MESTFDTRTPRSAISSEQSMPLNTVPAEAVAHLETADITPISLLRNAKLGTFHIGSALADVLTAGVWNRVMITELGVSATPISLLIALKYFIAPLSIWAGQRSDVSTWHGYRRLPFVWGGRLMMVLSFFLLGFSTIMLIDGGSASFAGTGILAWLGITASFVIFSIGSAFSGTTFLALIYDVAPIAQRTRVVSVVWFFLISGFAFAGIFLGRLLPTYPPSGFEIIDQLRLSVLPRLIVPTSIPQTFAVIFLVVPLIMGAIWLFSLFGEEKPVTSEARTIAVAANKAKQVTFWADLRAAWNNRQTRIFFLFLGMTTTLFYTQDVILEPFGGSVFGMSSSITARFTSYWASMTLISIVVSLVLARRFPKRVNNTSLTYVSLYVLSIAFGLFFVSAVGQIRGLVTVALIVMGLGLGAWTVGTLGLMVDMTRAAGAGLYLSLWTLSETFARGIGTILGGVIRDVAHLITNQDPLSYGLVFLFQAVGFAISIYVLHQLSIQKFHQQAPSTELVMTAGMD